MAEKEELKELIAMTNDFVKVYNLGCASKVGNINRNITLNNLMEQINEIYEDVKNEINQGE